MKLKNIIVSTLVLLASFATAEITYYVPDPTGTSVLVMQQDEDGVTEYEQKLNLGFDVESVAMREKKVGGDYQDFERSGQVQISESSNFSIHSKPDLGFGVPMGVRLYDPYLGMFFQPDPLDFTDTRTLHLQRYLFAANNPFAYEDHTGESALKLLKVAYKIIKNKGDVKKVFNSEVADAIENAHTLVSPNATAADKAMAVFELATGMDLDQAIKKYPKLEKRLRLTLNKIQGAIGEKMFKANNKDDILAEQVGVYVTDSEGNRKLTIVDAVMKDGSIKEVKTGGAQLTAAQKALADAIRKGEKDKITPAGPLQKVLDDNPDVDLGKDFEEIKF